MDAIDFALFASACHFGARLAQAVELDEAHCRAHESQSPPTVQLLCTVQHIYRRSHTTLQQPRQQTTPTPTQTQSEHADKQDPSKWTRAATLRRDAMQRARWRREQYGQRTAADLNVQLATTRNAAWCAGGRTRSALPQRERAMPRGEETWDMHEGYEHAAHTDTNADDDDDDEDSEMSGLDGEGGDGDEEEEDGRASEPVTPSAYEKKLGNGKTGRRSETMAGQGEKG